MDCNNLDAGYYEQGCVAQATWERIFAETIPLMDVRQGLGRRAGTVLKMAETSG